MTLHPISEAMKKHYTRTFAEHGSSSMGVDWGNHEDRALLRHQEIAKVFREAKKECSILDVGCGYGAFMQYLNLPENSYQSVDYTGIDVVSEMIETGKVKHPKATFICDDVLQYDFQNKEFDYVICNGILTQKLASSDAEMEAFAHQIIKRMFMLCKKGVAFNIMSSYVNFKVDNLFYKDPSEMLNWIMRNVSPHVELNHAYPLYEYMVYIYKEDSV